MNSFLSLAEGLDSGDESVLLNIGEEVQVIAGTLILEEGASPVLFIYCLKWIARNLRVLLARQLSCLCRPGSHGWGCISTHRKACEC